MPVLACARSRSPRASLESGGGHAREDSKRVVKEPCNFALHDVWNEPGADNAGSYPKEELKDKTARVTALLSRAFESAREASPRQPLTSGVWAVDTSPDGSSLGELQQIQLCESDFITFHNCT